MKANLNLILYKISFYTLVILCLLFVRQVIGSQSQNEPNVSLKVVNLPLDRVLNRLAQETGLDFQINQQWKTYPINASFEAQPLHQALKQILRGLNHTIIYESGKSIKIVVYGKMESQNKNSNFTRYSSSPTPRYEPEIESLRDPDLEDLPEIKDDDENFTGSVPSEETDIEHTQNEIIQTIKETDKDTSEESNTENETINEN